VIANIFIAAALLAPTNARVFKRLIVFCLP